MSDLDLMRPRGVPFRALVDAVRVAVGGTKTIAQLSAMGVTPMCQVSADGVESSTSATLNDLRSRGIPFFCEVTELGVDPVSGDTVAQLSSRGIPGRCVVDATGIAQGGSATIAQLSARGIGFFCPVDEDGNETTLAGSEAPAAPTLDLQAASDTGASSTDNITSDTTPTFDVGLPSGFGDYRDAAEGDVLLLQISDNASFTSDTPEPLDAGDVALGTVPLTPTALADGIYYARARLERGAINGSWSSTLQFTIDATAATISTASTASVAENSTLAIALAANETIASWTIRTSVQNVASLDYDKFEISGTTLRWASDGTKDFENPSDSNTDNDYVVVVRATDTAGNTTDKTITVTVTDLADSSTPDNARIQSAGNYRVQSAGNYRKAA